MTISAFGSFRVFALGSVALLAACGGGGAAPSSAPPAASVKPAASVASAKPAASASAKPAASASAKPAASASAKPAASAAASAKPAASGAAASAKPGGPRPSFAAASAGAAVSGTITFKVTNNAKIGGNILTDDQGWTVYQWDGDTTPGQSKCMDQCLTAWPAVTSAQAPMAPAGFTGRFALITRSDNVKQVTLNDKPLYYFSRDTQPGDANGEGSTGFGAPWHVVKAS